MMDVSRRRLKADSRIVFATSRIAAMIRTIAMITTPFLAPSRSL